MATVSLSPILNGWQGFSTSGLPLNGGFIYTYQAGTTTPLATYTTSAGSVANANPIQLGSDGRPPQEIWVLVDSSYKFVVTDSLLNVISTYDNISHNLSSVNNLSDVNNAVTALANLGGLSTTSLGVSLQNQTTTAFTTGGTSTAYTLTPTPAISSLAVNQRFNVTFNQASGVNPTLAISGQAAKNLKQYDSSGAKVPAIIPINLYSDVEYDGTDYVILMPLPISSTPAGTMIDFCGASAPTGFLLCDGTSYLRDTYPNLFTAIGVLWGSVDGTHFNVPNFTAGLAAVQNAGVVGAVTHGAVISHYHVTPGTQIGSGGSAGVGTAGGIGSQNTSYAGGTDNLAAGYGVLKCIKY